MLSAFIFLQNSSTTVLWLILNEICAILLSILLYHSPRSWDVAMTWLTGQAKIFCFTFILKFLFQAYKFCMKMFNCVLILLVKSNVFILYYINTLRLIKERKDNEL
jgi:hypothetical protein